jgi:hypothetical protein
MITTASAALDRRIDEAADRLRTSRDASRGHALAVRAHLRSPLVWLCAAAALVGLGCAAAGTASHAARAAGAVAALVRIASLLSTFWPSQPAGPTARDASSRPRPADVPC